MTTVVVLKHPEETERPASVRRPPVRITLTGTTLVTHIGDSEPTVQTLLSPNAAHEHLNRVLRLRQEDGYRVVERNELEGEAPTPDPLDRLVSCDDERRRASIDFEEDPISVEEVEAVVGRLAAAAPVCIEHIRSDEVPGGLLAAALARNPLPSVTSLVYIGHLPWAPYRLPLDDLADLWAALPNLERVDARGPSTVREARHAALRLLHLESERMAPGTIAALGSGSLPSLSALGLMLGQDHGVDRMTAGALRSLAAPGLEAIRIAGLADLTSFLAELTEHPLPDSWAMLHLLGSVGDEDELLAVLRDRAPRLRSIAMLGLPLASALSDHGVAEVKALLPWVVDVSDTPDVWPPSASDAW